MVRATCQPWPTSPSRASSGTPTSVKNTSLKPAPPLICRIGRICTPGASAHLYFRRARTSAVLLGTETARRAALADRLGL